jgi:hypothetical protein
MPNREDPSEFVSVLRNIVLRTGGGLKEKVWVGTSAHTRTVHGQTIGAQNYPFSRVEWRTKDKALSKLKLRQAILDPSPVTKYCLPVFMQTEIPRQWMTIAHHQRRIVALGLADYPHLFRFSLEFVDDSPDSNAIFLLSQHLLNRSSPKLVGFLDVSPLPRTWIGIDTPNRLCEACAKRGALAFDALHRGMFADAVMSARIIRESSNQIEFSEIQRDHSSAVVMHETFTQPLTPPSFAIAEVFLSELTAHMNH